MDRAPVLFVSHGSPLFALEPGSVGAALTALGRALKPGLQAVAVVSPHWQTRGLWVSSAQRPATLHDFGGFPAPLYQLQYPAAGAPAVAERTLAALAAAGLRAQPDARRGLDHGAWVPLRHLFPDAGLSVLQISLPADLDSAGALRLGAALAPLRELGVLLLGSGSLTHNLGEFRRPLADRDYVDAFGEWVQAAVQRDDRVALGDWEQRAPHARRAHPTTEHFLPLLVALGATTVGETAAWIDGGGIRDGVLRMDGCGWGLPGPAPGPG